MDLSNYLNVLLHALVWREVSVIDKKKLILY